MSKGRRGLCVIEYRVVWVLEVLFVNVFIVCVFFVGLVFVFCRCGFYFGT